MDGQAPSRCRELSPPILSSRMIELLTTAEMAEADRLAIAGGTPKAGGTPREGGTPSIRLMENAGRAVADAVTRHAPGAVCVVAGPGNNGGGGLVFARGLARSGHPVRPLLHCGPVEVADIGIADDVLAVIGPRIFANARSLWAGTFPMPLPDGHKYHRGHAVVVSGDLSHTGAARLAARGALRAGAGLVTLASPRDALAVNAAASLAVMVRLVDGAAELAAMLADRRLNTVVL